jgi:hypothetical protein
LCHPIRNTAKQQIKAHPAKKKHLRISVFRLLLLTHQLHEQQMQFCKLKSKNFFQTLLGLTGEQTCKNIEQNKKKTPPTIFSPFDRRRHGGLKRNLEISRRLQNPS